MIFKKNRLSFEKADSKIVQKKEVTSNIFDKQPSKPIFHFFLCIINFDNESMCSNCYVFEYIYYLKKIHRASKKLLLVE